MCGAIFVFTGESRPCRRIRLGIKSQCDRELKFNSPARPAPIVMAASYAKKKTHNMQALSMHFAKSGET